MYTYIRRGFQDKERSSPTMGQQIPCLGFEYQGLTGDPGDAAAISIGSIEDPGDGAAISDEKVEGEPLYFPTQYMMDLLVGSLSPACLSIHCLPIMAELDAIDGNTET